MPRTHPSMPPAHPSKALLAVDASDLYVARLESLHARRRLLSQELQSQDDAPLELGTAGGLGNKIAQEDLLQDIEDLMRAERIANMVVAQAMRVIATPQQYARVRVSCLGMGARRRCCVCMGAAATCISPPNAMWHLCLTASEPPFAIPSPPSDLVLCVPLARAPDDVHRHYAARSAGADNRCVRCLAR